ncbi:MAG: hypothetical protein ABW068_03150 [Candidatus Thiodiazotropha sp.]
MLISRIYLLVPDRDQAEAVVMDLIYERIMRPHIHAIAKPGVDITGLPPASPGQRKGWTAKVEHVFWDAILLLFFVALMLLPLALWTGEWAWAAGCAAMMITSLALGYRFASRVVPQVHPEDFNVPLRHGEILLLVDVPRWRINAIERHIRNKHPEVDLGGVGWGYDALGI